MIEPPTTGHGPVALPFTPSRYIISIICLLYSLYSANILGMFFILVFKGIGMLGFRKAKVMLLACYHTKHPLVCDNSKSSSRFFLVDYVSDIGCSCLDLGNSHLLVYSNNFHQYLAYF